MPGDETVDPRSICITRTLSTVMGHKPMDNTFTPRAMIAKPSAAKALNSNSVAVR